MSTYHYSENAIANLLSFAKLADDYYIICNTRADDAIYVQSKDGGKYLRFQRDHKFNTGKNACRAGTKISTLVMPQTVVNVQVQVSKD